MRAAAAFALILAAACTDYSDRTAQEPLERPPLSDDDFDEGIGDPGFDVVDVDRILGSDGAIVGVAKQSPCNMSGPDLQRWADETLACSACYALLCGGEVGVHVCTGQCGDRPLY